MDHGQRNGGSDYHPYSVLKAEVLDALQIDPEGIYLDCTAGGGGHSLAIAERLRGGRLIALDRDAEAIAAAGKRLEPVKDRVTLVHSNFVQVREVLASLAISELHGALIDLGVSSHQLDDAERGFSYMQDAPLDMRMDRREAFSARELINEYSEAELRRVLWDWGEEKFAPQIARKIVAARGQAPIETTVQLADLIKEAIPAKARQGGHHPAKRSFQAIRIEVNHELDLIEPTLRALVEVLRPGGRLAVITFHSLEDRITKKTFASYEGVCSCPKDFPVCVCGCKKTAKVFKAVAPGARESEENPRSRSARLRVLEKL